MKQTFLVLAALLLSAGLAMAQDNHPVVGISDNRPDIYGLRGASVISSYDADPVKTDILVVRGRIKALGKDLEFPEGTTVFDLEGKIIYPSFIDIHASYGVQKEKSDNDNPAASYMRQMQRGGPSEDEPRVADYWNQGIHESYDVLSGFKADNEKAEAYRKAGFGAVVTSRDDGIARGRSALVSLADDKTGRVVLKANASVNYSFDSGSSDDRYPTAQYGAIALLRQFYLDGQWYAKLPEGYFFDASLEALRSNSSLPKIFEVSDKYEIMRADAIADEFGIKYIIRGGGNEYQMLDEIKKAGVSLIVPLDFPEAPDVKDPYEAATVPLSELKHWEMAPGNAGMISKAGIEFALTSDELSKPGDFPEKLRKAVEAGLAKKQALKALTYTPAKMIGAENMLGAIREGMVANMLVCSGDIFDKDCVIHQNWIQGSPYSFVDPEMTNILGSYSLVAGDLTFDMLISGKPDKPSIKIKSGR
ncbi:MAG: amidohydrolase family protein [Bacteroidales bacterium]|nr:amidohydrolase family protein [Bacteroidales bacterium]